MLTFEVVNGDIPHSESTGRPRTVEGEVKFRQDVRENLNTSLQENGTGANLDNLISTIGDTFSIRAELSRRVTSAFEAYQAVQNSIQRFERPLSERISRVVYVNCVPLRDAQTGEISHTSFAFKVDVLSGQVGTTASVTGSLVR